MPDTVDNSSDDNELGTTDDRRRRDLEKRLFCKRVCVLRRVLRIEQSRELDASFHPRGSDAGDLSSLMMPGEDEGHDHDGNEATLNPNPGCFWSTAVGGSFFWRRKNFRVASLGSEWQKNGAHQADTMCLQ